MIVFTFSGFTYHFKINFMGSTIWFPSMQLRHSVLGDVVCKILYRYHPDTPECFQQINTLKKKHKTYWLTDIWLIIIHTVPSTITLLTVAVPKTLHQLYQLLVTQIFFQCEIRYNKQLGSFYLERSLKQFVKTFQPNKAEEHKNVKLQKEVLTTYFITRR